jgi:hypothetical protein
VKVREALSPREAPRPTLARAEILDKSTRGRFEAELETALKRKSSQEGKLGGALRAVALLSPALRSRMADAALTMIRRKSFGRELYVACIRSIAETEDRQVGGLLRAALSSDEAGGTAALSAACFSTDPDLGPILAKLAASRQSHLAFGAETARVVRGESNGAHLTSLAPMIKESHRIALCVELFVPLARAGPFALPAAPALTVLRGAERHLGRWLVLAEVAARSGDPTPLAEAQARGVVGPSSARAAWSLVGWALSQRTRLDRSRAAVSNGGLGHAPQVAAPETRPTVELVSRLSDRPSADRDTTFLFRMARARAPSAKPMLEMLAKSTPLGDEVAVRAALCLAKDYGRDDLRSVLAEVACGPRREELRGLASAALWDLGMTSLARETASELLTSKFLGNVAWATLIRAASLHGQGGETHDSSLVEEIPFRWIQWGWLE